MSSTKKVLVSLHGKRVGVSSDNKLVIEGRIVAASDDSGILVRQQLAPATATTAATLTAAQLKTGILNATPTATGATVAYTLPTGALLDASFTGADALQIGDAFDWVIINNALAAADTITLTAGATHTIVGGPIVQSLHATTGGITGYSAQFRTRKTAADTFVTYRIG
jgi:hypothetical protein